jgi:hypothetical protein
MSPEEKLKNAEAFIEKLGFKCKIFTLEDFLAAHAEANGLINSEPELNASGLECSRKSALGWANGGEAAHKQRQKIDDKSVNDQLYKAIIKARIQTKARSQEREQFQNAGKLDGIDQLSAITDKLRLAAYDPSLDRTNKINAARPDSKPFLQFSEQLNAELRAGTTNKQVDQLKANIAAKSDFSLAGPSASSKQVGGDHYKDLPIQPVEYCQRNGLGFCESSVVKYVSRYKAKNGVEDLRKARHFLDLLIEMREKDTASNNA